MCGLVSAHLDRLKDLLLPGVEQGVLLALMHPLGVRQSAGHLPGDALAVGEACLHICPLRCKRRLLPPVYCC
jgi:hypothetical protein